MTEKRKYWVTVKETRTKPVEIEAENEAKAMFEAQQQYMQGKIQRQLAEGASVKAKFSCGPFATESLQAR